MSPRFAAGSRRRAPYGAHPARSAARFRLPGPPRAAAAVGATAVALVCLLALAGLAAAAADERWLAVVAALALAGWWWGSVRLTAIDRSPLTAATDTAGRVRAVVTGPVRRTPFRLRAPVQVVGFAGVA